MNPVIINANKAKKHLEKIKAFHTDMIQSMQTQAMKVDLFNQTRDMEMKEQTIRNDEMMQKDKDRTFNMQNETANRESNNQKANQEYNLKTKELELKKTALSQTE